MHWLLALMIISLPQERIFHGVSLVPPDYVWVCAADPYPGDTLLNIYYSDDFGFTWDTTRGYIQGAAYVKFWDVDFVTPLTGWAVGELGIVVRTDDGGKSWIMQDYAGTKWWARVKMLNDKVGWLVGGDFFVGWTSLGGYPWHYTIPNLGYTTDLYGVWGKDDQNAWFAGGYPTLPTAKGVIFKAQFGKPDSFVLVDTSNVEDYYDIYFINDTTGYLVGGVHLEPYNAVVYKTTDGGTTWDTISPGFGKILRALAVIDDTVLYAVGKDGTIIKSTDGGTTWIDQSISATEADFFDVDFISAEKGVLVGEEGLVFMTDDGGATWHMRSPLYVCGDANGDGTVAYQDVNYLGAYIFGGGNAPSIWTGDINGDWTIDYADLLYLANYLFGSGPPPQCHQ